MNESLSNRYDIAKTYYKNKNYKRAYEIFYELAKLGEINAQVSLGSMIYNGEGIEKNINNAYEWLKLAADKKDPEALYYCSMYYLEDIQEIDKGKEYLEKAVELNYASAITANAYYYEYGDHGYLKNIDKAIMLYKKACLLEDSKACLNLYSLLKEKNKQAELRIFIKENIGYLKYLKIILKDKLKKIF